MWRIGSVLIALLILSVSAQAAQLLDVAYEIDPSGQQTRLFIAADELPDSHVFALDGGEPRVVVDVKQANLGLRGRDIGRGQQSLDGEGHVARLRFAEKGARDVRLVLDLVDGASLVGSQVKPNGLVVVIGGPSISKSAQLGPIAGANLPIPRLKPKLARVANAKRVIVIDAGHGGRDPGAIGAKKTKEKDVTLRAAKELKILLEKTGRYEVELTRGSDVYVDHDDRLRIARAKGADLFISIHADSTGSSTVRGASVYTLADRALNRSKGVVQSQNWIMDVDLTEHSESVGDILVDLAQRNTLSQSSIFADSLVQNLSKTTKLVRNSHRRAGYYVLLAPDVPAVLLELGFISNAEDEKLLNSPTHRDKVLRSVVAAINTHFSQ